MLTATVPLPGRLSHTFSRATIFGECQETLRSLAAKRRDWLWWRFRRTTGHLGSRPSLSLRRVLFLRKTSGPAHPQSRQVLACAVRVGTRRSEAKGSGEGNNGSQATPSEYVSPSVAVTSGKSPKMQLQLLNPGRPTTQYAVILYRGDEAFFGLL